MTRCWTWTRRAARWLRSAPAPPASRRSSTPCATAATGTPSKRDAARPGGACRGARRDGRPLLRKRCASFASDAPPQLPPRERARANSRPRDRRRCAIRPLALLTLPRTPPLYRAELGRHGDGDLSSALSAQFRAVNVHAGLADLAMDALSEGISIADFTQRDAPLIYVNSGFCRMTGYSKAETVGHNCRRAASPRHKRALLTVRTYAPAAGSCKALPRTPPSWRTCAPPSRQASPSQWS
jgi:PAS domain-containing protein